MNEEYRHSAEYALLKAQALKNVRSLLSEYPQITDSDLIWELEVTHYMHRSEAEYWVRFVRVEKSKSL